MRFRANSEKRDDEWNSMLANLMRMAESEDEDEARKAKRALRAYLAEDDADTKPAARASARPALRIVPPPAPTPEELGAARVAQLPHEQQRQLARLDGRFDVTATKAEQQGSALVLKNMSPEHAAARAAELAKQGAARRGSIDSASLMNRQFTARPYQGR